jgi:hypothetical protein
MARPWVGRRRSKILAEIQDLRTSTGPAGNGELEIAKRQAAGWAVSRRRDALAQTAARSARIAHSCEIASAERCADAPICSRRATDLTLK